LFAQLHRAAAGGSLKITYGVETMQYANKLQGLRNGEKKINSTERKRLEKNNNNNNQNDLTPFRPTRDPN